jgi:hypothetical protein
MTHARAAPRTELPALNNNVYIKYNNVCIQYNDTLYIIMCTHVCKHDTSLQCHVQYPVLCNARGGARQVGRAAGKGAGGCAAVGWWGEGGQGGCAAAGWGGGRRAGGGGWGVGIRASGDFFFG